MFRGSKVFEDYLEERHLLTEREEFEERDGYNKGHKMWDEYCGIKQYDCTCTELDMEARIIPTYPVTIKKIVREYFWYYDMITHVERVPGVARFIIWADKLPFVVYDIPRGDSKWVRLPFAVPQIPPTTWRFSMYNHKGEALADIGLYSVRCIKYDSWTMYDRMSHETKRIRAEDMFGLKSVNLFGCIREYGLFRHYTAESALHLLRLRMFDFMVFQESLPWQRLPLIIADCVKLAMVYGVSAEDCQTNLRNFTIPSNVSLEFDSLMCRLGSTVDCPARTAILNERQGLVAVLERTGISGDIMLDACEFVNITRNLL